MAESFESRGTFIVGEMSVAVHNALLELSRIWACKQHIDIVIGFENHGFGHRCEAYGFNSHPAGISHNEKAVQGILQRHLYIIAYSLSRIVRHYEIPHSESGYFIAHIFLKHPGSHTES